MSETKKGPGRHIVLGVVGVLVVLVAWAYAFYTGVKADEDLIPGGNQVTVVEVVGFVGAHVLGGLLIAFAFVGVRRAGRG